MRRRSTQMHVSSVVPGREAGQGRNPIETKTMRSMQAAFCAAVLLATAAPALAAGPMTDKEKMRAQAEHDCYDDVQKLCSDVTDDEEKVKSCMKVHHAQLSPKCAKDFDAGMGK